MKLKKNRLSGINPLSYVGVEPISTTGLVAYKRAPTSSDRKSFVVGSLWLDETTNKLWFLTDVSSGTAAWKELGEFGVSGTTSFPTDLGTATVALGIINFLGGTAMETSGSGNTATVGLSNGTNGQLLIGSTSSDAIWANITSTGASVTITEGANTLNIEASGGAAIQTFTADVGIATPAAGVVTFAGGTNITTSAAASTVTIDMDANLTFPGTITLSDLDEGVMQTDATGEVFSDAGTDGEVIIGGGTEPNWANITSGDGTITITNGSNTINLESTGGSSGAAGFLLTQEANAADVLVAGITDYYLGQSVILTTIFDDGSDTYPGDGAGTAATFTAPTTGKYMLNYNLSFLRLPFGSGVAADMIVSIITSNRDYNFTRMINGSGNVGEQDFYTFTVCADMDSGDVAEYYSYVPTVIISGVRWWTILGSPTYMRTWISGYKVA